MILNGQTNISRHKNFIIDINAKSSVLRNYIEFVTLIYNTFFIHILYTIFRIVQPTLSQYLLHKWNAVTITDNFHSKLNYCLTKWLRIEIHTQTLNI